MKVNLLSYLRVELKVMERQVPSGAQTTMRACDHTRFLILVCRPLYWSGLGRANDLDCLARTRKRTSMTMPSRPGSCFRANRAENLQPQTGGRHMF